MTTILGLDMSSTCIGHALIVDGRIEFWGHKDLTGEIGARCADAAEHIGGLLDRYEPALIVIESPVARFAKAVIPQARVSGAVLAEFARRAALWQEVTPQAGKAMLAGDLSASKEQMIDSACMRLGLPRGDIRKTRGKVCAHALNGSVVLTEDEADAIGLALAGTAIRVEKVAA